MNSIYRVFFLVLFLALFNIKGTSQWSWQQIGDTIFTLDGGTNVKMAMDFSKDGSTLATGNQEADETFTNTGAVEVFKYNELANEWLQVGQAIVGAGADQIGTAICLNENGSRIVVGASQDGNFNSYGYSRVLEYNNETQLWEQLGEDIIGVGIDDQLGYSVSMNSEGNIIAISSIGDESDDDVMGYVRVLKFDFGLGDWQLLGEELTGEVLGEKLGRWVSLNDSGSVLTVSSLGSEEGQVKSYYFDENENGWIQRGQTLTGAHSEDDFGKCTDVSSDGNTLVIGAMGAGQSQSEEGLNAGHVYVFTFNQDLNLWIPKGGIILGSDANLFSGLSVSINGEGNGLVIGSLGEDLTDFQTGKAEAFTFNELEEDWEERGDYILGSFNIQREGGIVAMSHNSDRMASMSIRTQFARVFKPCIDTYSDLEIVSCGDYTSPSGDTLISQIGFHQFQDVIENDCGLNEIININLNILDIDELAVTSSISQISCNGFSDGSVTLALDGGTEPYSLFWNGIISDVTNFENLEPSSNNILVVDANGCYLEENVILENVDELSMEADMLNLNCFGSADGSITTEVIGGVQPYFYNWVGIDSDSSFVDSLEAGSYELTVNDFNGCEVSSEYVIIQPDIIELILTSVNVECYGENSGALTLEASGGTGSYIFEINEEIAGELVATGLAAGDYFVEVSDENNCIASEIITLTEPEYISGDANCNGLIDGDETAGDSNLNGFIDGNELAGDVNGDGTINDDEILGDLNGDGVLNNLEVGGDANGDGIINDGEVNVSEISGAEVSRNIFPNPNSGQFEIVTSAFINKLIIINSIGEIVYRMERVNSSRAHLNLKLSAGVYVVQIESDIGVHVKKILIE
ncbi:MAG: T9SS type A sorting domain-containing protein [Flavobacteriales bacterium]